MISMGKDRLKRLLIVLLMAGFLVLGGKVFADWQAKKKALGENVSLSTGEIGEKISDFGENILGKAVEVLPGGNTLKQKIITEKVEIPAEQDLASPGKTQEIIEIIKQLPVTEFENIKKQVFKDFCQKVME